MGSEPTSKGADRRARIEEMRRAEQARDRRGRLLTISVSVIAAVAAVGVVSYLLVDASGDDDGKSAGSDAKTSISGVRTWDDLGRDHVEKSVSYPMDPPVGGDHNPVWMNCDADVYDKPLPKENAVHSLEHGAVWVTYTDKAAEADLKILREKVGGTTYSLMSPEPGQAGAIMLTAWGHQLTVANATDPRVERFFATYVQGDQTPEPGAPCTGGKSDPS
ncbi:DUF3105 domain-containing protein [Streptomyces sp. M19]